MTSSSYSNCRFVIAAASFLVLAACAASPTPYQEATSDGGYTDQKLEGDAYQVTFTGNAATPRPSIQKAVLFRAAQLTLQEDRSHFKVLSNTVESASEPSDDTGFGLAGMFGTGSGSGLVSTLDFTLLEGEPTSDDPNTYNAEKLIREFKDSVLSPKSAATAVRDGAIVNDLRAPRSRDF